MDEIGRRLVGKKVQKMKFLSVCSGIEAASVAWEPLGWKAVGFSEIEPFPSAVLKHHYPDVPNYGDMTTLAERITAGEIEAPDLLCGGTPCQAFSVAGLRKSLDDARGNLTLTFCEIANAIDHVRAVGGREPSIVFWENVPGVLNTKDNAFGCFLGELAGESCELKPAGAKWTNAGFVLGPKRAIAWRVLDAQYFGVAQRRRRVFVVASARDDFNPAKVLFEWEGVRRDTAPSREAGQGVANALTDRADRGGTNSEGQRLIAQPYAVAKWPATVAPTLNAHFGEKQGLEDQHALGGAGLFVPAHAFKIRQGCEGGGKGYLGQDDLAFTLSTHQDQQIAQPVTYDLYNVTAPVNRQSRTPGDPCHTLARADVWQDRTGPLDTDGGTQAVAQPIGVFQDSEFGVQQYDNAGTLRAGRIPEHQMVMHQMAVRRLTPVECERLQGFPDNYTNIPWRKAAEAPDGPRYKALGNSWAVPVVRWIGRRIALFTSRLDYLLS